MTRDSSCAACAVRNLQLFSAVICAELKPTENYLISNEGNPQRFIRMITKLNTIGSS